MFNILLSNKNIVNNKERKKNSLMANVLFNNEPFKYLKTRHTWHLVDPSPWPIFCSFATLILAVGAVYYFKTKSL